MKYEVTGHVAESFDVLTSRAIGEQFEAELDPDVERLLVDVGALRVVEDAPKKKEATPSASKRKAT